MIFKGLHRFVECFKKKLAGPLGIGKSALLMQAVNYAMCKPWIVIYIPDGKDFINYYRYFFYI